MFSNIYSTESKGPYSESDTPLLNSEDEQFRLFHLEMETNGQKVQTLTSQCASMPL